MPSLFHRRDRSTASSATVTEFGGSEVGSAAGGAAPLGRATSRPLAQTMGSSSRQHSINQQQQQQSRSRATLSPTSEQGSPSFGSSGPSAGQPRSASVMSPPLPGASQTQSPTAAMHNIRAVSELLNARKVYRAGYIYRLDDEGSANSNKARFARYYVRLEDCILCLWSDEGLKKAQQEGKVIHPSSMNLVEGFVALAEGKQEWMDRCDRYRSPTEHCLVLNTAGSNSLIFCCESELDLRHWMNVIRLAIWERQRLETLYTGIRFGIKEEQQLSPIKSAIQLRSNGARFGRVEGLMDVRLPGDTEWKRVYAVLTEPSSYHANAHTSTPQVQNGGLGSPPIPQQPGKKEKRKSVLSGFFGSSSSSRNDLAKEANGGNSALDASSTTSAVSSSYNQQLEDVQTGPTLALFGILSSPAGPSLPNSPSARNGEFGSSGMSGSPSITSLSSSSSLKLTNRPVVIVNQIWSTYAVWPESEALIPHSKTFKVFGKVNWRQQEISSYPSSSSSLGSSQSRQPQQPGAGILHGFEESMRRENRDSGREGGEGQLLCMLVSGGAGLEPASGPGNAVKQAYKNDAGGELLSWVLGIFDAFQLHGRPEKLIYDQRHPLSPYFAQPIGPARGGLYFETALIEDLQYTHENRPRAISDQFSRILYERMNRLGALSPGVRMPNYLVEQRQGNSMPPVLPPISDGASSRSGRPTSQGGRSFINSTASESPRITAGQLQPPASQRERSASPLRSRSPPQQEQQGQALQTPFETPPLATPRAVQQLARNDDLAESQQLKSQNRDTDDSLSQAFDRAMSGNNAAIAGHQEDSSRSSSPRSQNHPTILRPGSANSSNPYARKPSLEEIHQGRNLFDTGDSSGEGMYVAQDPQAQEMLESPVAGPAGRRELPNSPPRQATVLSTSAGSGDGSTLEQHYNAFPVRSNTPSRASISSSSALSSFNAPATMPGQYVATPGVNEGHPTRNSPSSNTGIPNGQPNLQPTTQRSLSPPGGHVNTQAPPSFYTAASPARTASTASTVPSGPTRPDIMNANTVSSIAKEESVLSNESGALYALSLADEEDSQAASSVAVSRESSREGQQQQQQQHEHPSHHGLSEMIRNRAVMGNNGNMASPISGADSEMARTDTPSSSRNVAGEYSAPPTRSGTIASVPVSAAPTSASAYSQDGTMHTYPKSGGNSTTGPQPQGNGYGLIPMPTEGREEGVARHLSVRSHSNDRETATAGSETRHSKISSHSTAEGQDDYLAGLNYLALTADQESAQPVSHTSTSSPSSPPIRPPRSPRMATGNKPIISVQTSSSSNSGTSHPEQSGQVPQSASTTSPIEPLSPDPYGTYTEGATSVPRMHLVNSSPPQQQRKVSTSKAKAVPSIPSPQPLSAGASSRKPGRRGVPITRKSNKKLGSWSSDEEDEEQEKDSDAESQDEDEHEKQQDAQNTNGNSVPSAVPQNDEEPEQRRESVSSGGGGSLRRNLPALPGPSTDPYINQNSAASTMGNYPNPGMMPYDDPSQYIQYPQNRNSMFGWPGQAPMGMMAPWQQQQMMGNMSPYGQQGQGSSPNSPYGHSPSPSIYNQQQYQQGMGQNTMLSQMGGDGGAEGRAARNAALAPHGLLQAGLQDRHAKSAAQMEANAKESGGPLVQLAAKPQGPQGGLVGAIANHERERKREGGIGATLTERERERRTAEARQREMDQMHARQASFGGMPGGPAFPGFGAMPNNGMGGGFGAMDPAQMQQQMAMLAAQNAYLQAMAGFQNPLGMGMGAPQGFMSPPFSPQPGFGGPASQSPYAGSYLGMPPPQHQQHPHPASHGNSPMGHGRRDSSPQPHAQRGDSGYFRQ